MILRHLRQDRDLLRLRTDEDFMDHLVKVFAKEKSEEKQAAGAKVLSEIFTLNVQNLDIQNLNMLESQISWIQISDQKTRFCHFFIICFIVYILNGLG